MRGKLVRVLETFRRKDRNRWQNAKARACIKAAAGCIGKPSGTAFAEFAPGCQYAPSPG
jgi:hypothetical protein